MSNTVSETAPRFTNWDGDGGVPEGCEDFEAVTELSGTDWEWDRIDFWWSPSKRRYFWYEQSGCSCNGPFEYMATLGDFGSGHYADAARVALDWDSTFWDGAEETQKNKAMSDLQKHNIQQKRRGRA